jgi:hypothetical protein
MLVLAMQFSRIAWLRRERPAPREEPASSLPERAVAPSQRNRDVSLHFSIRIPRELNLRSGDAEMPTNQ